jgi:hypothetical protein
MKERCALILMSVLALLPRLASGQSAGAEAEQLFRDAKRLMSEGKYAEACSAFDTSHKLDPVVTTLINRADCREKNGQLATAWSLFLDVDRATRNDAKRASLNKTAKDRAAKLEARLSYMTVSIPTESRIDGLSLTRNGTAFEDAMWNRAIPVDGGDYVIAGRAAGHEEWSTTVHVPDENGRVSVDVPKFKEIEKLIDPATSTPVATSNELAVQRHAGTPSPSSLTGRRKVALGAGAIGLVAAGGGIVLGLQATGFESDAYARCRQNPCASEADAAAANALVVKARQRALFANIGYGVAVGATVAAAVLWFTGAPERASGAGVAVAPSVSNDFVGLAAAGSF